MTSANEIEAQKALINNAFKKWINPLLITPQYTDLQKKTYMAEPLLSNYIQHNATIRKIRLKQNIDCGFYKDIGNYIKFIDKKIYYRKNNERATIKINLENTYETFVSFEFIMEKKENGSQFSILINDTYKIILQIPESTFNFNTMFPVVFERENINVNDYIHYT